MDSIQQRADVLVERPVGIIWETTPASDLAAWADQAAGTELAPLPLSFAEACDLVDQIAAFGSPKPALLLTGGDPLQRADLCDLVRYATSKGTPVGIALPGTPLLTAAKLQRLKEAGAVSIVLSLNGSTPELHDGPHCVPGSFERTVDSGRAARAIGLRLQIVSTVTRANLFDLPDLFALVRDLAAATWHVSFPGPDNWAQAAAAIAPMDYEAVLNFLYDARRCIRITTSSDRHFRRVTLQRMTLEAWNLPAETFMRLNATYRRLKAGLHTVTWGQGRAPPAGGMQHPPLPASLPDRRIVIDYQGDVFCDGDRSRRAGNIRETALADIYSRSLTFRTSSVGPVLPARCSRCEFRWLCGATQAWLNVMASGGWDEPLCAYEPGSFPFVSDVLALAGIT